MGIVWAATLKKNNQNDWQAEWKQMLDNEDVELITELENNLNIEKASSVKL